MATLKAMLDVAESQKTRNDGKLIRAVLVNDLSTVRHELAQGDINLELTFSGKPFLLHAGERGHLEIARCLLACGANPNVARGAKKYSLLHSAVASQNYGFASVLLERDSTDPSPRTIHNATPLHFASRLGHDFLTKLLIRNHAEIDAKDSRGRTPLHLAFLKGHSAVANSLHNASANPKATDRNGLTPVQVAEGNGIDLTEFEFHLTE